MVELTVEDRAFLIAILRGTPLQGTVEGGIVETALRIQSLIARLSVGLDGNERDTGDVGVDVGSLVHSKEV